MDNSTNCTGFHEKGEYWRARGDPFEWFDGIVCLFALVGIVGNSLVLFLHCKLTQGRATPTNRLIICLAAADLLTAICIIPIPEYQNLPRSTAAEFYCHLIESRFFLWVSFRASVYTLTVIAIERFLAIVYPFAYKVWTHARYVRYAIAAIWLCPVILRSPQLFANTVGECGRCDFAYRSARSALAYSIVLFVMEFVGPLIIITYTSTRIIIVMGRERFDQNVRGNQSATQQSTQLQSMRRRFTIMFIFIGASFMLLWTPDQLGIFLYRLGAFSRAYTERSYYQIFLKISLLNGATTNPIIYSVCLPVFRRALKDIFACRNMDSSRKEMVDMTSTSMPPSAPI